MRAGTCILFGDGCGAVVLTQQQGEQPCSLLGSSMASDGLGQKHLNVRVCFLMNLTSLEVLCKVSLHRSAILHMSEGRCAARSYIGDHLNVPAQNLWPL